MAPQLPRPIVTSVRTFVLVSAHSAHHIVITRATTGWLQASATKWAYPDFVAARVAGVYIRRVCFPEGTLVCFFSGFPYFFSFFLFIDICYMYCLSPHGNNTYISTHKASWKLTFAFLAFYFINQKPFKKKAKERQNFERVRFSDYTIHERCECRPGGFLTFRLTPLCIFGCTLPWLIM